MGITKLPPEHPPFFECPITLAIANRRGVRGAEYSVLVGLSRKMPCPAFHGRYDFAGEFVNACHRPPGAWTAMLNHSAGSASPAPQCP